MGRAGLIGGICGLGLVGGLALVAGLSGCDLVFPPGPGPGAGSDAGPPSDGTTFDASGDGGTGDASQPDSSPLADAACEHACNGLDQIRGTPHLGVAGCESNPSVCPSNPLLAAIDACTCSAGEPELYVIATGNIAEIGLVAPFPTVGTTWSLSVDNGVCIGGAIACAVNAPCAPAVSMWGWTGVQITLGQINIVRIYEDDGSGCNGPTGQTYTFSRAFP